MIYIKKGFDIPISGKAEKRIRQGAPVSRVAVKPSYFPGIRPRLLVRKGDPVSIGTTLVEDKGNPAIRLVSPGGGKVAAVIRGERRKIEVISIELDEDEPYKTFPSWEPDRITTLSRERIIKQLLDAGLWPMIRQRPYGNVADPEASPRSVYVSGIDTEPLAADPAFLLEDKEESFKAGLALVVKLTTGTTYLCVPGEECRLQSLCRAKGVQVRRFSGPHPAGLVSTHIQYTEPYRKGDIIWYLRAVDVALIGDLFLTGRLNMERIIAVAGPGVKEPCYVRTRAGAPISAVAGEATDSSARRYVSGTILTGREEARGDFLGVFATTLTVMLLNQERKFLGWLTPRIDAFSWFRLYGGHFKGGTFPFSAMVHGSDRPILPIGCHEDMTPLDIYPTFLIKAILAGDLKEAEYLGLLELVEEDMALITYADPSKMNYGEILRQGLERYQKEG